MRQVEPRAAIVSSLAYLLMNLTIKPYLEVDTIYGKIRGGRTVARNGRPYAEFLNIPYAQPPLGKLRFESPQPPFPWTDVQDATYYGNSCLQYEFVTHFFTGSEDCLNLNVYTNHITADGISKPGNPKPVIVYFYGGLFMSGFTSAYRAKYFMEEDVVLVTVGYRVNVFGFLNTGDGLIRGNMGLKDQVMALNWVKNNILSFGGDPNLVTIMGQSAGGASTHFHLLSKMASGLFHRAISMSGTALNPWSLKTNPREQADTFAKKVGCFNNNRNKMVTCLKGLHPFRLTRAQKDHLSPVADPITLFAPTIETVQDSDAFLTTDPRTLIKNGTFPNHVPWMTGVTNGEGLLCSAYLLKVPEEFRKLESDWHKFMSQLFKYEAHPDAEAISEKIHHFYFGSQKASPETFDSVTRLYSDVLFNHALFDSISMQIKTSKAGIYAYYFTYSRDFGLANHMTHMLGRIPRYLDFGIGAARSWFRSKINPEGIKNYGVSHSDDLTLLFNMPALGDEITPGTKDYTFSNAFVKLVVSFARDGLPIRASCYFGMRSVYRKPAALYNQHWEHATLDKTGSWSRLLFELGDSPGQIALPFQSSIEFWKNLTQEYNF